MTKWTVTDLPDQRGRTAVVTGANSGIGLETSAALAGAGAHVVLAVRDVDRGKDAQNEIKRRHPAADTSITRLDLTSLQSVRDAATELTARHPHIDLLINNAGIMLTPRATTVDGFELQFGTNHLGHFALCGLLFPCLAAPPDARVVTVSSLAHKVKASLDLDDLHAEGNYDRMTAYGRSKLANLLFTYELQRRLDAVSRATPIAVAAHPGNARTALARNSPWWIKAGFALAGPLMLAQPAAMGALPTLRASCDPAVRGGQYYGPRGVAEQRGYPKIVQSSSPSHDAVLARRLWKVSEELTGVRYPV